MFTNYDTEEEVTEEQTNHSSATESWKGTVMKTERKDLIYFILYITMEEQHYKS